MWIKRAWLFIVRFKVGRHGIPLAVLPIRCFQELLEGFGDIVALFKPATRKILRGLDVAAVTIDELQAYGKLDVVDIAAPGDNDLPVNIKILMR